MVSNSSAVLVLLSKTRFSIVQYFTLEKPTISVSIFAFGKRLKTAFSGLFVKISVLY